MITRRASPSGQQRWRRPASCAGDTRTTGPVPAAQSSPFDFYNSHRYAPLCAGEAGAIRVDSSWYLKYPQHDSLLLQMMEDFKAYAKDYGVEFSETGKAGITVILDETIEDEEYHELTVTENAITVRAGSAVGILRGLRISFWLDILLLSPSRPSSCDRRQ